MRHLPPTIHDLLAIPRFAAMMDRTPRMPENLNWGTPWRLWVLRDDGTWGMKEYEEYQRVWAVAQKAIADTSRYQDVCIVSKRRLIRPSDSLRDAVRRAGYNGVWCPRCRRPSYFGSFTARHHALKLQPTLTQDEPYRCYYCGIRKAMVRGYA